MRLIDAEHLMSEVEKLKESPWFNENINGARIVRREAINIVEDLCICQEPTVCDIEQIKAEIGRIEIIRQVDEHTAFIRSGEQVKQMALDIVDKYKGK